MRGSFATGFASDGKESYERGMPRGRGNSCGFMTGHPLETAAIILGFIVFWPIGLGLLALKLWRRKAEYWNNPAWASAWRGPGFDWGRSGNSVFDDWKHSELERLEEERRKLADAERDFAFFLDQLRRAKDREEFDRFMAARRAAQEPSGQHGPAPQV
jgi:hypothetical protein